MVRRLMTFVKGLFGHGQGRNDGQEGGEQKAREQQDKLDKQRADWEGMTPNNP